MPLPPRPLPPSSIGWLCGGPPPPFSLLMSGEADEVAPVLLLPFPPAVGVGNPLLPLSLGVSTLVGVAVVDLLPGSVGGVSVVAGLVELLLTSRCSGEAWEGELLFLLCASPPRFELRGETLPVCASRLSVVSNLLKLGAWSGFDIPVWPILDRSCCRDLSARSVLSATRACCVCGNWHSL